MPTPAPPPPKRKSGRANSYAGILQPRQSGAGSPEVSVLVLYDIENDRTRNRVADVCLNYGLERIQFSAFMGKINRNRRQQLALELLALVGPESARIRIVPIAEDSLREMWVHDRYQPKAKPPSGGESNPNGLPRIRVVVSD